ncbi:MAG: Serine acetyltransferase (EC [uncultured Sulfurovum sp.]|uniref:Serine acetyltransferase n=1 Tax=uncultured Sulfurovum sp. TaxID=269237 RepID=A0A6S6TD82_9BACT|nr:MAG: Serine acetyltransferase (EC [uncultured Sulfurovum sp.]
MNLFKNIADDFYNVGRNDPALHSKFELFFNYPGLWALFYHRIAHSLYKRGLRFIPRFISGFNRLITTVDIHPAAQVGERVFIDHGTGVVIGETAIIGNDVVIYQQVTLGGVSTSVGKRHPTVGDRVVIGAGAKILGNITIGDDAKIGANSVVVKNVPCCATAVGVPARILKCDTHNEELRHDVLPDVNKEIFHYLIKRIAVLEETIKTGDANLMEREDHELEEIYATFIKSM